MTELERAKLAEITKLAAGLDSDGQSIVTSFIDGFVAGKAAGERSKQKEGE